MEADLEEFRGHVGRRANDDGDDDADLKESSSLYNHYVIQYSYVIQYFKRFSKKS